MKKVLFFSLSVISILYAQVDEKEIDKLFLQTLNEVSEIALHNKLNIEKIPSTVTVIRRDLIEASGAKTLLDILELVPGIEITMSSSGKRQIVIRGMRSEYRDKLKLLINGVDVTNNLYSNQFYYYTFPAELIKRVEVTKTPDSILYGSNAFMGSIHIITLDEESKNSSSITTTSQNGKMASMFQTFKINEGYLSIDGHFSSFDPNIMAYSTIRYNEDNQTIESFREPMPAYAKEITGGVGISYKKDEWHIGYRLEQYTKGSFFGISNIIPLVDDKDVTMTHNSLLVEYNRYINTNLKLHCEWSAKDYIWDGSYRVMPYNSEIDNLDQLDNDPDNDLIMGAYINEVETGLMSYLRYTDLHHNVIAQIEAHYAKPIDMYYIQYIPSNPNSDYNLGPNGEHLTGEQNILKEGIDRKNFAIAVEDLYSFSDKFSATAGLRVDYYSNFNSHLSYKVGSVYNLTKSNTVKFLYNHAFRAPSWIELYANAEAEFHGNEDLKPETMDMVELNWLYSFSTSDMIKLNLFYGKNSDPIIRTYIEDKAIYDNGEQITISGYEVSYRRKFDEKSETGVSVSHHKDTGTSYYTIYNHSRKEMLKFYLDYELLSSIHNFLQVEYGSKIDMPEGISDIDSYVNISEVVSYTYKNATIKVGVKNLLDQKIEYVATPSDRIDSYRFLPEGMKIPAIGREWFISLKAKW
jgi:iron complex outermembrane receptor protein